MNNSVIIDYPSGSSTPITVLYTIAQTAELQTISCSVDSKSPLWLQLRNFTLSSVHELGFYVPLFNEVNSSKNMDTSLFIDLVYTSIMKTERFKCRQQ